MPDLKFYQVYVRGDIIYLSQNGEFLISGHIISTINNTDITQKYIDEKKNDFGRNITAYVVDQEARLAFESSEKHYENKFYFSVFLIILPQT